MALAYLFDPNIQNQTLGGVNNVGGFLRVYIDGTDDRATTYKDFSGTLNKADIELDANGRAVVVVDDTKTYRMEVYSRDGFFMWSVPNLTARGSGGGSGDSVVVDGTPDEIDVTPNQVGGVMHYVASLAVGIKSALSTLQETVNTLASSLRNKKDKQQPVTELGSTTKVPVSFNQDDNGEIEIEFDDISFPDWTSAINDAVSECEKTENKKNSLIGYESSTIAYPSIKAVVDFVNAAISTFLTKTGDGSNVTATFTAAGSRTNISSGEKLSVIFGKIAKWFSDLKAVAFSGSYTDLSDKPTIPAAANNGVLTIKQNGTSVGTFSANQSSNSDINVTDTTYESKSEASGGTSVSLVTTGEKYNWNHKQDALPSSGTPTDTFAINVSGTANNANSLNNVLVCSSFEIGSSFGNVGIVNFGSEGKGRLYLEIHVSRYLNGDNSVIIAEFGSDHQNVIVEARILNPSCPYNVYYKSTGNTYEYEVWVCDDAVTGGGTRRGSVIADVSKVSAWTPVSNVSPSTRPSGLTQFSTWHVAMTQNGAGSSRLPVYVDADGTFNPMNVDEYYCWANPTAQWTDVMEMDVWYVQNQCNNEILGSVRSINLNATHPSLCYMHVKLPNLEGAGRYRFTLEFDITNSNGQNGTSAYGVLILDPPTGYSGESFLAECAYDSSGKAQSSVMNQIHVPPQGSTYRHKLYVDGHTYRVVKVK